MFRWIPTPKAQRGAFFIIYLFHLVAGVAMLFAPPEAFTHVLGYGLSLTWAGFLVFGGALGAIVVLPGWNFLERIAILAVVVGISICSVVVLFTQTNSITSRVTVWSFITAWIVVFLLRAWEIRLYSTAPKSRE